MLKSAGVRDAKGAQRPPVSWPSLAGKMQQMALSPTPVLQEVPKICLAHRWLRNRTVVQGTTVFPFDDKGVATVSEIGSVKEDMAVLLRSNRGFFLPGTAAVSTTDVVPPTTPEAPVVQPVAPEAPVVAATPSVAETAPVAEPEPKETQPAREPFKGAAKKKVSSQR
jgi:hypothetical protein